MPGMRSSDVEAHNSETQKKEGDLEEPTDYEEKVDFDADSDQGDTMMEEGECEVEEQEEAGGEETEGIGNRNVADTEDGDEKKKNAELLELPPHGSVVYLGDIPHNASEEDLRDFCQSDGDNDQGDTMMEEGECEVEEKEEAGGEREETEGVGNRNVADTEDEDEKKKKAELLELPPHGSVVYLGGIPHNASEEDLRDFCQSVGDVFNVSIVRGKYSGKAKVYAFVTFKTKEMASEAIEKLNKSIFQGNEIKCSTSTDKNRLFINNIPRHWTEEDLRKAVTEIGPGVDSVELLKETKDSDRNRGFAFIKYYNHACAEYSRQNMSNPKFKLGNNGPTVKWAEPKYAESAAASQVKAVYVQNLPENITRDRLKESFEHHGKITKVVIPAAKAGHEKSRYGFVQFAERSSTMKALEDTETYEIDGQVLQCSLAKRQPDHKSSRTPVSQNSILPTYPLGYGLGGGAYGALDSRYAQASGYGGGVAPAGMVMMPTPLPDGRIGYVLQQQPVLQQHSCLRSDVKDQNRYHPY